MGGEWIVGTAGLALSQQVEVLYADHHGWLRGLLRRKLGNAFDAADLAHDVYLHLIHTGRLPPAGESRRHLTQIANGLVIDLYRRRRIEAAYLDALARLPEPMAPSEEARALAVEALVQIDAALQGLPAKARQALLMSRLDGLAYRDIAAALGVSVSSVEKYIAAGLLACYRALYGTGTGTA
jgi:RNA polymerase sigma-70 factor (ECF subfamily)